MSIMKYYLNGKRYFGEACYINGWNGYEHSDDDGLFCALINHSCWGKGRKPNVLRDENGNTIRHFGRDGILFNIDENGAKAVARTN